MGVGGQCHALAALHPGKRDPLLIVQVAMCTSGPFWTGAENLPPTGIQVLNYPVLSESLYQLRHAGPHFFL